MNPYPNDFYNDDHDEEDQFSDGGFSERDYDTNESESYYSQGSFQESLLPSPDASFSEGALPPRTTSNDNMRGSYSTASSSYNFEDSFANATIPSDFGGSSRLPQSMGSLDELGPYEEPLSPPPTQKSRAAQYRKEFEELIEMAEGGKQLTADEDDRLYCLELFARNQVGKALTEDEQLDLEDWLQEEAEAMEMEEEQANNNDNRDKTQRTAHTGEPWEEETSENLNGPGDEPMASPPVNNLAPAPKVWEPITSEDSLQEFPNNNQEWEESLKNEDDIGFSQQPGMVESESSSDSKQSEDGLMGFEEGGRGDQVQGPPPANAPMNEDARPQSPNWSESHSSKSRGSSRAKKKKKSSTKKEAVSDKPRSSAPFDGKQSGRDDDFGPKNSPRNDKKQSDWGDGFGDDPFGGNDEFGGFGGFGGETSNKDGAFESMSDPFSLPPKAADSTFGGGLGNDFAGGENDVFSSGFGDVKADEVKFGTFPSFGGDWGDGNDFESVQEDLDWIQESMVEQTQKPNGGVSKGLGSNSSMNDKDDVANKVSQELRIRDSFVGPRFSFAPFENEVVDAVDNSSGQRDTGRDLHDGEGNGEVVNEEPTKPISGSYDQAEESRSSMLQADDAVQQQPEDSEYTERAKFDEPKRDIFNLEPPIEVQETGEGENTSFGSSENQVSASNMRIDDWSNIETPPSGALSPHSIGVQGAGEGESINFGNSENQVSDSNMSPVDDWSDIEPPPSGLLSPQSARSQPNDGVAIVTIGGAENQVSNSNMTSVDDWSDLKPPTSGLQSTPPGRSQEDDRGTNATSADDFKAPSEESAEDKSVSRNSEKDSDSMNQEQTRDIELSNASNKVDGDVEGERPGPLNEGRGADDRDMEMPDIAKSARWEGAVVANQMLPKDNQPSFATQSDVSGRESEPIITEGAGDEVKVQTHRKKVKQRKRVAPIWAGLLVQSRRDPSSQPFGSKTDELNPEEDESQPREGVDKIQSGEPILTPVIDEPDFETSDSRVNAGDNSGHLKHISDNYCIEMMTPESNVPRGISDVVVDSFQSSGKQAEHSSGNDQPIDSMSNQTSSSGDSKFDKDDYEENPNSSEQQRPGSIVQIMPRDDSLSTEVVDQTSRNVDTSDDREKIAPWDEEDSFNNKGTFGPNSMELFRSSSSSTSNSRRNMVSSGYVPPEGEVEESNHGHVEPTDGKQKIASRHEEDTFSNKDTFDPNSMESFSSSSSSTSTSRRNMVSSGYVPPEGEVEESNPGHVEATDGRQKIASQHEDSNSMESFSSSSSSISNSRRNMVSSGYVPPEGEVEGSNSGHVEPTDGKQKISPRHEEDSFNGMGAFDSTPMESFSSSSSSISNSRRNMVSSGYVPPEGEVEGSNPGHAEPTDGNQKISPRQEEDTFNEMGAFDSTPMESFSSSSSSISNSRRNMVSSGYVPPEAEFGEATLNENDTADQKQETFTSSKSSFADDGDVGSGFGQLDPSQNAWGDPSFETTGDVAGQQISVDTADGFTDYGTKKFGKFEGQSDAHSAVEVFGTNQLQSDDGEGLFEQNEIMDAEASKESVDSENGYSRQSGVVLEDLPEPQRKHMDAEASSESVDSEERYSEQSGPAIVDMSGAQSIAEESEGSESMLDSPRLKGVLKQVLPPDGEFADVENTNNGIDVPQESEGSGDFGDSALDGDSKVDCQSTNEQSTGANSQIGMRSQHSSASSSKGTNSNSSWDPHATFQIENKDPKSVPVISDVASLASADRRSEARVLNSTHSDGDSDKWSSPTAPENATVDNSFQSQHTKSRTSRSISTKMSTASTLHSEMSFHDKSEETKQEITQVTTEEAKPPSLALMLSTTKDVGNDEAESIVSKETQSIHYRELSKNREMPDEKSVASSKVSSKMYQQSENSIYLGEVFGKSESFFSDYKTEKNKKDEDKQSAKDEKNAKGKETDKENENEKVEKRPEDMEMKKANEKQNANESQHSRRSLSRRSQNADQDEMKKASEKQKANESHHSRRSLSRRSQRSQSLLKTIADQDEIKEANEKQKPNGSQHSRQSLSRRSQSQRSQSLRKTNTDGKPSPSWRKAKRTTDRRMLSLKSPIKKDKKDKTKPRKLRTQKEVEERKKKRRKRRRVKKEAKSPALLAFVASVNSAMLELEQLEEEREDDRLEETSAHQLLNGFDALMGIFLQLSDEIELMSTFAGLKKKKESDGLTPYQALKEVLSFAESLDQLFADLKPIILDCFEEEPDEMMEDMLFRLNSLVDLLCETSHRVGEKQEWNDRAETTYVTLLELMELETLELQCYFEDVDVPEQGISENIHEAWSATGHIEERDALELAANDPILFRQICYEVMVSTDQWCPDVDMLMEICDIDPEILEEEPDPEYLEEEDLAPIPRAAEHVLDKINGDPLPRSEALAAILRRILPPRAMTDLTLLDNFTSIRNTLDNPLGLSATNLVAITSAPEVLNDPGALGVAGVGKTTLAAMVAEHPDVRRYFIDGVVWIYVGDKELTYSRYTQCLRDLVAQLDFYDGVPLFAELIHTPGECLTKRRRREEGFMIYARDTIVELLEDRSVLIILDDVCFEPDLDWFDFAPMPEGSQDDQGTDVALLVSTRVRDLLPAADTVEVDMLDEDDAIALLIQESGQLSHTLMAESKEARSVVRECANHPLAVKSVGRWLGLKHVTAGAVSSVEEIHAEVVKSMEKILKGGDHSGTDMMYEILSLSLSPAINGEATNIIKYCFAAFVIVFCDKEHISEFAMTEPTPIVPMDMAQLLFETLLEINESALLQEGSLFYAQKKEAAVLIPEALSALGVLKVGTYSDADDDEEEQDGDQKFLQVVHSIHHEYGEYLCFEEPALKILTRDAEQGWNRALAEACLKEVEKWDENLDDAGHSYVLEMIVSHMIRGAMYKEASDLLANMGFVRGRLMSLGRECATRRHIKDCILLSTKLNETRSTISKLEPRRVMKRAYRSLGSQLGMEYDVELAEDPRIKEIEISRSHYEIGFSLAENRCWEAAIAHWESCQKLLKNALGTVEVVAGIMYNIAVAYAEMNEYEQALNATKQCLRIRGTIHGEQHILYAQTIQKIGDIFMGMSDYNEAVESYSWALEVMNREPTLHRVEIGEIQDHKGSIHRSKGELEEALKCHQEALRSKQMDLGEDHPELFVTYQHIGNCLSEQGNEDDAIVHLEEAIRLKELDLDGGAEGESDILTLEGFINYIERNQEQGLECYEKALQILVSKARYRKEKIASLLHLIGCVYLTNGEHKKAMKLFEESLRARRKVLGYVHLEVASTLFNMAHLYQSRNRLDKALRCLEEALKIRELRIPETETVAMTHAKIGSLCRAIGKKKKAQIEFEKALQLRNMIHGKDHISVASVLQELGDLMDDIGEYDQALSNYVDALDIRRTKLGIDDVAVAETLYSMGYTLQNNDEPDRALVCFDESLSIRKYQLGDDSKEVGDTLNMMGFLKAKRGDLEEALTILWDALRIRKKHKDKIKVSETLNNIGNVHREKQDHNVVVQCYEECLRIRRAELGDKHEKVADSLVALGNIYGDMKKNEEAMQAYQEALKILTKVFGERDERVATVLQYMGTMEHRSGNQDRARELFTEFIKIRKEKNAMNDGDYVNVLFTIGNIHKTQGNLAQARVCWTEAYQVFQELDLEETYPQIAEMMNELLRMEVRDDDKIDQRRNAALAFFGIGAKRPTKDLIEPSKNIGNRQNGKAIQL